ncbi:MAG: hypothetical protein KAR84_00475 [Elusimicrobiales bacterium]|nr:hypothetical protein [Elusimicrobiales bacterium]
MAIKRLIFYITLMALSANSVHSAEPALRFKSFYKAFLLSAKIPNAGSGTFLNNKFRTEVVFNKEDLRGEFAYEINALARKYNFLSSPSLTSSSLSYRAYDTGRYLFPRDNEADADFSGTQNIDRAFLSLTADFGDFHIGRQPIAFGMAKVINPTDILAPYDAATLDTEERLGVDALRVKIPLGLLGEFDGGIVAGRHFKISESAAFLRTKFYKDGTDIALMAQAFKNNLLIGGSIVRDIGGAGIWTEFAHTYAQAFSGHLKEEDFFRFSIGADYNFQIFDGVLGFIEYHYNGAGSSDKNDYISQTAKTAYTDAGVYLLSKQYLIPGFSTSLTPLISANASIIYNLNDYSSYFTPRLEYNIKTNMYLGLGANLPIGKKAVYARSLILPESEFGLYSDYYYSSIRVYF